MISMIFHDFPSSKVPISRGIPIAVFDGGSGGSIEVSMTSLAPSYRSFT